MVNPICIIQARLHSTRLANKMLLKLGNETLIARGHRLACEAFGKGNTVVAIPAKDVQSPLMSELARIGARVEAYAGVESDLLARYHEVAHKYRWHPESIVFRWTADDYRKSPEMCRRVAAGERLPVEQGGEAFTLAMLDRANLTTQGRGTHGGPREHITHALFPTIAASPPNDGYPWTIDTPEDYAKACEWFDLQSAARAYHDQPGNMQR